MMTKYTTSIFHTTMKNVRRYLACKSSIGQSVSLVVVCDFMQTELGFNLVEPQLHVSGVECRYFGRLCDLCCDCR